MPQETSETVGPFLWRRGRLPWQQWTAEQFKELGEGPPRLPLFKETFVPKMDPSRSAVLTPWQRCSWAVTDFSVPQPRETVVGENTLPPLTPRQRRLREIQC